MEAAKREEANPLTPRTQRGPGRVSTTETPRHKGNRSECCISLLQGESRDNLDHRFDLRDLSVPWFTEHRRSVAKLVRVWSLIPQGLTALATSCAVTKPGSKFLASHNGGYGSRGFPISRFSAFPNTSTRPRGQPGCSRIRRPRHWRNYGCADTGPRLRPCAEWWCSAAH